MITLALDEFGDFEGVKNDDKPVGIAGILYDDAGDKSDLRNERNRIREFYKRSIGSVAERIGEDKDLSYPNALHSNNSKDRDSRIVKPVKRKVNGSISEFLKRGTFDGKELLGFSDIRKGKYYIFAFIKSDRGMTSLLEESTNFLVKDDQGSNLYFHMACETVGRMLFHNPVISNIREVSMEIATRRSDDMDPNSDEATEYYRQGYTGQNSINPANEGQVYFGITNADIYRSALSQEIIRSGRTNISINGFSVKPIKYTDKAKDMEFLYLADSICTYISNKIVGDNDKEKLIKIVNKANCINEKQNNIIFGYDEIDTMFQKAWYQYEQGLYYEALETCYDSKLQDGGFSSYYQKWFEHIRQLIERNSDERKFTRAVRSLHDTIKTNTIDQDRMVYILESLEKMIPEVSLVLDDTESQDAIYAFYDTCISAYCHIGDSKKAITYYNKCKKYAARVSVEQYLETLNKMSETLLDNFEWRRAKQVAEESLKYQKELLKMKNALPVYELCDNEYSVGLSKAYSQNGQIYAFLGEPKAESYLRMAMNGFPLESADYRITQSYLLHYYLDNGMEEKYREESRLYFGGLESPREQLEFILEEGFKETPVINYKYALYVYIRGIYTFRLDEISDKLKERLYDIETQLKKAEIKAKGKKNSSFTKLTGHPTEIIFKYLSLIACAKNDTERVKVLSNKMHECIGYAGDTIELIRMYGDMQIAECCNAENIGEMYRGILEYMISHYEAFKNLKISEDDVSIKTTVDKYLSYMYR